MKRDKVTFTLSNLELRDNHYSLWIVTLLSFSEVTYTTKKYARVSLLFAISVSLSGIQLQRASSKLIVDSSIISPHTIHDVKSIWKYSLSHTLITHWYCQHFSRKRCPYIKDKPKEIQPSRFFLIPIGKKMQYRVCHSIFNEPLSSRINLIDEKEKKMVICQKALTSIYTPTWTFTLSLVKMTLKIAHYKSYG